MKTNNIKAILFDFDGVLADTMNDNFRAWEHAFKRYGIIISKSDFMLLEGMSPMDIARKIGRDYDLHNYKDHESIVAEKEQFYRKNNNFKLYLGTEDLLGTLKKNKIKLALVSGTSDERIYRVVSKKFLSFFDVLVTANSVVYTKPHPQPYKTATKLLNVEKHEAIAIENAPLGIQAAKSAGIYCIALCSTLKQEFLTQADEIVSNMSSLNIRLKELI